MQHRKAWRRSTMSERNQQTQIQLGKNIEMAFGYVQQVFRETAQIMTRLDELMGHNWESPYTNYVSRDLSSALHRPNAWLTRACYRIYHSTKDPDARRGITVVYRGYEIEQPILIVGRVEYVPGQGAHAREVGDPWDLRKAWFEKGPEDKKADGTLYPVRFDEAESEDSAAEAQVFAIPLVSIQSEDDIRTEVYDRLMAL
jgi:hypothetical protein